MLQAQLAGVLSAGASSTSESCILQPNISGTLCDDLPKSAMQQTQTIRKNILEDALLVKALHVVPVVNLHAT